MTLTRLLLTVALSLILWPAAAHAQSPFAASSRAQAAQICSAMFGTEALAISIGPTAIKFSFDGMNNRQITEFVNAHGGKSTGAMGMTKYNPDYRFTAKRNVLRAPVNGWWCWRDEIHLELARLPVEVHISSDYRNNQCIQRAIHDHEMDHVNVFHSYLRYLAGTIQERFGSGVGKVQVSHLRPTEEAEDQTERINAIREAIDRATPRMNEIHDEVDSGAAVRRFWANLAACEKPAAPAAEPQKPAPMPQKITPARAAAPITTPLAAPAPTRPARGPQPLF